MFGRFSPRTIRPFLQLPTPVLAMTKLPHHLLSASLVLLLLGPVLAQEEEELEVPEPESVTLMTKDRVQIHCTYYAGGFVEKSVDDEKKVTKKHGKEVVPIIMVHGWEGSRREFDVLASTLQRQGHAVMVPDLRGHGSSTVRKLLNNKDQEIDRDKMRREDMAGFVADIEAVRKFLLKKNNAGELNMELLCVVGADVGAIAAVNWAAYDWNRQQLPAFKRGMHVKALVLLSPKQTHKGFTLSQAMRQDVIRGGLSMMLVVGAQDRKALVDTKALYKQLERFHKEPPAAERLEKKDLFKFETATSLQGTELLRARGLNVNTLVQNFISLRLVRKSEDHPWNERKNPIGGG